MPINGAYLIRHLSAHPYVSSQHQIAPRWYGGLLIYFCEQYADPISQDTARTEVILLLNELPKKTL